MKLNTILNFQTLHFCLMLIFILLAVISSFSLLKNGADPKYVKTGMIVFPFMFYSILNANMFSICHNYLKNDIVTKTKKIYVIGMSFINMLIFVAMIYMSAYFLYTTQLEYFNQAFKGMLISVIPLAPILITILFIKSDKTDSTDSKDVHNIHQINS